jgi:Tfp pilus assembly protein PilE
MKNIINSLDKFKELPGSNLHSRQRGASAVESLLYIVLVAVLAVAVYAVFTVVFSSTKVQTEKDYMSSTVAAVRNIYGTSRDFGTANITTILVNSQSVPQPMIVGTGLRNSWNGVVTVTGSNDTFTIQTDSVPRKECMELSQLSIAPVAVRINGTGLTLPLNPTSVSTACSTATNTIAWLLR